MIIGCILLEEKLAPFSWRKKNAWNHKTQTWHSMEMFSLVDKYRWKTYSKYHWDVKERSVCSAWEVGGQMVRKHRNFSLPKHMLLVWLCSTSGVRNSYNYCYIKLPPTGFIMLLCSVWIRSLVQCWWLFLASEASAGRTWSLEVTGMAEVRVNKDDYCSDMASKSEMLRPSWGQVTLTLLGTYVESLLTW